MTRRSSNSTDKLTIKASEIPDFGWSDERIDAGWEIARIGTVTRDSDCVERSNHRNLMRILSEIDPDGDAHGILGASHWACGWVDHLIVNPAHEAIMAELRECADALACYPILSESDWSELESEDHEGERCDEHCGICEGDRMDHRRGHCCDACVVCRDERREHERTCMEDGCALCAEGES